MHVSHSKLLHAHRLLLLEYRTGISFQLCTLQVMVLPSLRSMLTSNALSCLAASQVVHAVLALSLE